MYFIRWSKKKIYVECKSVKNTEALILYLPPFVVYKTKITTIFVKKIINAVSSGKTWR